MTREEMVKRLEAALLYLLCRTLEGEERDSMEIGIRRFILDEVSLLTEEAILSQFSTPQKSVARFIDWLERIGAHREAGITIH